MNKVGGACGVAFTVGLSQTAFGGIASLWGYDPVWDIQMQ